MMLGFLVDLLSGFVSVLAGILPRSPFADLSLSDGVHSMLGWVNWVIPFQPMLAMFGAVVGLLVIVRIGLFLVRNASKFSLIATGGD